jgi:hypothetical protein
LKNIPFMPTLTKITQLIIKIATGYKPALNSSTTDARNARQQY